MVHFPSFIIGSLTTGSGFLLIHKELSHRRRLSKKWVVQEKIEEQVKIAAAQLRASRTQMDTTQSKPLVSQASSMWNQGISALQDMFRRD